ncbi:MAG: molybdopterin-dependent aldehyde oxidoreductase [Desulfosporosinus fructosivorans]
MECCWQYVGGDCFSWARLGDCHVHFCALSAAKGMILIMTISKMFLNINGAVRMVVYEPDDNLANVLRQMGLTGTKVGCDAGQCGACSILLDGKVTRVCTRKMKSIKEFSKIITIEGIGTPTNLHPIQMAWIAYGGVQCGFCSPGFIVSTKGLLDTNSNPTRQEVRRWFQRHRNICRCTGYKPLVDAVMAAAQVMRGEMIIDELVFKIPESGRIYNTYYPRPAAVAKVTGTSDFGADMNLKMPAGALQLALVHPKVSHAKILSIDTSEAEKMPGVFKIITHKDVKGKNRIFSPVTGPYNKCNSWDRPILNDVKVHMYGDTLAIVAADTRKNALAAAEKIKAELELLPEYMDALDVLADDAVEIHPGTPNIYVEAPCIKGEETESIFASAPYIVEGSFYTQRQPHGVLEPECGMAYMDEEGRVTVHCKTLALQAVIFWAAAGVGLPPEKIRVVENPTGASFGSALTPQAAALMIVAAMATGKPVCLELQYDEHTHFTGKRAPSYSNVKLAADKDGKLIGLEFDAVLDHGAYSEKAELVATKTSRYMGAGYHIPNILGLTKVVFTNHSFGTAFRAFGSPQAYAASEQVMDMLAEKIGMDPLEFRYINVYRPGSTTPNGTELSVHPLPQLLDMLRPKYKQTLERTKQESTPEKPRGVGIAVGVYNVCGGENDTSNIDLELNADGSVTSWNGWEDQGQGADVGALVLTHEALKSLGLDPKQIILNMNDTALAPTAGPAAGSRSHFMNGNATIDAANKLMNAMRKPDGTYRTHAEMVAEGIPTRYTGTYTTIGLTSALNPFTGQGDPNLEYMYGVFMAEVEVDTKTGKTKVLKSTMHADVGVIGNKLAVDGQMYGGLAQGVGLALSEDYQDLKKSNIIGLGIPAIEDIPDELDVEYLETYRAPGPFGSVGCGELPLTSPHAAILNAIYNACGVRIHELPAYPEKVIAGLKAIESGKVTEQAKYDLGPDFRERLAEMKLKYIASTQKT